MIDPVAARIRCEFARNCKPAYRYAGAVWRLRLYGMRSYGNGWQQFSYGDRLPS